LSDSLGAVSDFYSTLPTNGVRAKYGANGNQPKIPTPPADLMAAEDKRQFLGWVGTTLATKGAIHERALRAVGLRPFKIPAGTHAMSGGGVGYITGGLYNADMVSEALLWAGVELSRLHSVLDWGGSSGRSIAMWQAAFQTTDAHLADPIRKSIAWAKEHLDKVKAVSSHAQSVRTRYKNASLDLVFGISIWSHYNFGSVALPMLKEMRRIIKPGGCLVITSHGWASLYSKITDAPTAKLAKEALQSTGHFYVAAFPGNVDWDPDTENPDWGMSWVDPAWLMQQLSGMWKLKLLLNARSDCLQDLLVLERM